MASDEVQGLAEAASDDLEVAKPHAEKLAWHIVNAIARPVLNSLGQSPEPDLEIDDKDLRIEFLADYTDWLHDEPVDVFNSEVDSFRHDFESKELPELLLFADPLDVAVPSVQCSKSQLISLIWEAL